MAKCSRGESFMTRLEQGALTQRDDAFKLQVKRLLFDPEPWAVLPLSSCTVSCSNLAFAMLSTGWCYMESLMFSKNCGYPLRLWTLLKRPECATSILRDPVCVKDKFTLMFLASFPTVAALQSEECRAELLCCSVMARRAVCRIECRHAALRRRTKRRVQTHRVSLADLSADHLMARQRCIEQRGRLRQQKAKPVVVRQRKRGKYKGKRTGGGGRRRAAMSELLGKLNGGGNQSKEARRAAFKNAHRLASTGIQQQARQRSL
jgi:hypothetical protein